MATHDSLALHPHDATGETAGEGLGGRMMDRLRQTICGLHGHDNLVQFEHERMFLRCVSCGHETPGWDLNETPRMALARRNASAERRSLAHAQLIHERRIA